MAGLQRSSGTFRRSGSSGMVWDDDRHLSGEIRPSPGRLDDGPSPPARVQRSRSTGHGGYRAGAGRVSPALDPPSPRVGVCGFCGFFGGKTGKKKKKRDGGKDKSKVIPRAAANRSPKARRAGG
ncbi:hypothetical protein QYE76_016244 [Lolium multiflorum]|uniref:Uncharacterized protein n=1 Tax=Lolium multiflorum TaxID=4521 RepID=A0AAD8U6C4_LOLMU|nr:hypothetical protein QYE76_016244 [Lolium multiflorum]